MARFKVELPEEHADELKVAWGQKSRTQNVKGAKTAEVEVPDGQDFVLESGGVRQTFRADGNRLRMNEPATFKVNNLEGVPRASDVVTHPEEYTVDAIKDEISKTDDRNRLRALLKDERKGVKEAAQKRLDELSK